MDNKELKVGQIRRRKDGLCLLITHINHSYGSFSFIVLLKDKYSQVLKIGKEYKDIGTIHQWQDYPLIAE